MWTVEFKEYLNYGGVKENIKKVKEKRKAQKEMGFLQLGKAAEQAGINLLSQCFKVDVMQPAVDIAFGADCKASYVKDEKHYSFYVDITTTRKNIKYLSFIDGLVSDPKQAFMYQTQSFNLYFGFKERHANWFFYEKPVLVMYIERFQPGEIDTAHMNNIANILITINEMLMIQGHGARASQKVRPNPKRYQEQYIQYVKRKNNLRY